MNAVTPPSLPDMKPHEITAVVALANDEISKAEGLLEKLDLSFLQGIGVCLDDPIASRLGRVGVCISNGDGSSGVHCMLQMDAPITIPVPITALVETDKAAVSILAEAEELANLIATSPNAKLQLVAGRVNKIIDGLMELSLKTAVDVPPIDPQRVVGGYMAGFTLKPKQKEKAKGKHLRRRVAEMGTS